jgi:hypothetical protein
MVRYTCPHCGEAGISGLRKVFLGPAIPAHCSLCGGAVGVPWWSLLTLAPWFAAILLAPLVRGSGIASFWLGAIGALVSVSLCEILVPLVKR